MAVNFNLNLGRGSGKVLLAFIVILIVGGSIFGISQLIKNYSPPEYEIAISMDSDIYTSHSIRVPDLEIKKNGEWEFVSEGTIGAQYSEWSIKSGSTIRFSLQIPPEGKTWVVTKQTKTGENPNTIISTGLIFEFKNISSKMSIWISLVG
jgi:hypothetical protein